jgi:hypothetical protein
MSEKEAIIILAYYNEWRQGSDIPMQKASTITEAIKKVIDEWKKRQQKDEKQTNPRTNRPR